MKQNSAALLTNRRADQTPFEAKVSGGVQPFLSSYERIKVALKCNACGVIFWPRIFADDSECPFCGSGGRHEPLISGFRPEQDPNCRMEWARKEKARLFLSAPPKAWERYWSLTDTPHPLSRLGSINKGRPCELS